MREAAREFEELTEQDLKERLRGVTSKPLEEGDLAQFRVDVRAAVLDDPPDPAEADDDRAVIEGDLATLPSLWREAAFDTEVRLLSQLLMHVEPGALLGPLDAQTPELLAWIDRRVK